MKQLSVKWLPEAMAAVSLTFAVSQEGVRNFEPRGRGVVAELVPGGKRIVISGHRQLRAEIVMTAGRDRS